MSLFNLISEYFINVVNYTDFVLAVDESGVFVFSQDTDDKSLLIKVSNLMSALALQKEQIIICVLDNRSGNVYSSFDCVERDGDLEYVHHVPVTYLEDFIRKYTKKYAGTLTYSDVNNILDCFCDVGAGNRNVELVAYLHGYGLSDEAIDRILNEYVITKELVYNAGVRHEDVEAVYNMLVSNDTLVRNKEMEVRKYQESAVLLQDKLKSRYYAATVLSMVAALLFVIGVWWVALPISISSLFVITKIRRMCSMPAIAAVQVMAITVVVVSAIPFFINVGEIIYEIIAANGFEFKGLGLWKWIRE
ncbi:hypothetical protein AALB53_09055 [Lachnospiraceae bacterium 47-T17]